MDMVLDGLDLSPESLEHSSAELEGYTSSDTGVCGAGFDAFFLPVAADGSAFSVGGNDADLDDARLFVPMSDLDVASEKVLIRKEKNRQCAKKSRQQQRERVIELEKRVPALEKERDELTCLVQDLYDENLALKAAQHGNNPSPDSVMGPTLFLA